MPQRNRPVVAIDGPSGVGKSTVAKRVARQLGYAFIDTGALYRTVAKLADDSGVAWSDGPALAALIADHDFAFDSDGALHLDGTPVGDSIRTPHISQGASQVAALPEVRAALLDLQRALGTKGGVVLEGRDIGTAVFPDAECKIFLTASVEERARRRWLQLRDTHPDLTLETVIAEQQERDHRDSTRSVAPLRRAPDAHVLETDGMDIDAVTAAIVSLARQAADDTAE